MLRIKRIVLDVLKPHTPNVVEFAKTVASQGPDYHVDLTVVAVDEKTESLEMVIEGNDVQLEPIQEAINSMGGSLHSIDGVEVHHCNDTSSGE